MSLSMPKTQHPFDALIEQFAEAVAQRLAPQRGAPKQAQAKRGKGKRKGPSAEGIERIRAAAKKRWARFRKEQAAK
jgi:hypothetical protein